MCIYSGDIKKIYELGEPPNYVSNRLLFSGPRLNGVLDGSKYLVYPAIKKYDVLIPPIDWSANPYNNRSWVSLLHSLRFLGYLLQTDKTQELIKAAAIAVDYIQQHPNPGYASSDFTWSEKIVGDRIQVLAYLLRVLISRKLVSQQEAVLVLDSIKLHADFLLDETNYHLGHNHGLAQDIGLYIAGSYFNSIEDAIKWRRVAARRFINSLQSQISNHGMHLEHSPGYHFMVKQWLFDLLVVMKDIQEPAYKELKALLSLMDKASVWLIMPDGSLPPVGDTARRSGSKREYHYGSDGVKVESGYGFYKKNDNYLLISAGHHSSAHKHSDDTSFIWFDQGKSIVTEAGKLNYEKGIERSYTVSALGHNVLLVDNESWLSKNLEPYGTTLSYMGENNGWHGFFCFNPHLNKEKVNQHARHIFLGPETALLVIDYVKSKKKVELKSLVHFSSEGKIKETNKKLFFNIGNISYSFQGLSSEAACPVVTFGKSRNGMQGWVVDVNQNLVPAPCIELKTYLDKGFLGYCISKKEIAFKEIKLSGKRIKICMVLDGKKKAITFLSPIVLQKETMMLLDRKKLSIEFFARSVKKIISLFQGN